MPQSLAAILTHFQIVANNNVRCPVCQEQERICKNGHYPRYRFIGNSREMIPRYLCKNPRCPRVSFSILPHPFLPWLRVSLCLLAALGELWTTGHHTIAALARQVNVSWQTMRRWLARALWLRQWRARENDLALAGWRPCADPRRGWTPFTQALSHALRSG